MPLLSVFCWNWREVINIMEQHSFQVEVRGGIDNKRHFAWLMLDLMRKLWIVFKGQLFCQNDTSYSVDTNTAEEPRKFARKRMVGLVNVGAVYVLMPLSGRLQTFSYRSCKSRLIFWQIYITEKVESVRLGHEMSLCQWMVHTVNELEQRIDFASVNRAEFRHYILLHFHFHFHYLNSTFLLALVLADFHSLK